MRNMLEPHSWVPVHEKARNRFSIPAPIGEDEGIMLTSRCFRLLPPAMLLVLCGVAFGQPRTAAQSQCRKAVWNGEVSAERAWSAPIGQGWVFRVAPIEPRSAGYSGWDLVVNRNPPAGFPDALFLATPPYNSISEREIGTTFGLRAQDAIGWNPRTFNFILDPGAFHLAQSLYLHLQKDGAFSKAEPANQSDATDMSHLLDLQKHAATGEFRIDDARLIPGIADPAPYAQDWSQAASRTPHEVEASGPASGSPRGSLDSMRFSITLWLPQNWKLPAGVKSASASCP